MARFTAAGLSALISLSLAGRTGVDAFAPPLSAGTATSTSTLFASASDGSGPRTLYDKIWDDHVVTQDDSSALIYIDRHLVHEVRAPRC